MTVFFFQAALQEDLALDHNNSCGENSSDINDQPSSSHIRVSTNGPAARYSPTTKINSSSNRTLNDNSSSSSSSSSEPPRQVNFIPIQSSPLSSSDSESDGEHGKGDDPLSGELEKLVGMKCCAPFFHDWGKLDYHNALVMSAVKEQGTDKILVSEILLRHQCVCQTNYQCEKSHYQIHRSIIKEEEEEEEDPHCHTKHWTLNSYPTK
jgi:hypothetical protein